MSQPRSAAAVFASESPGSAEEFQPCRDASSAAWQVQVVDLERGRASTLRDVWRSYLPAALGVKLNNARHWSVRAVPVAAQMEIVMQ